MKSKRRIGVFSAVAMIMILLASIFFLSADASAISLQFIQARYDNLGLGGAMSVAVSPDGKNVYAASSDEDSVAVFARQSSSGTLYLVEVERDGSGSVDGLNGAWSVTVSPDGKHVYVAGRDDNAVAAFSRNSATGELTFLEVEKQGVGGVDGLDDAVGVGMDPDGDLVYVAGYNSDAVAWFERDSVTGLLTWEGMVKDGVDGVDGIDGVWSAAVSPGGADLYAAGGNEDSLAVFNRDPVTGALSFSEVKKNGVGGVDGLDVVMSVIVSPDGKNVYATGRDDEAIAVFGRNTTTGLLTFLEAEREVGAGETGRLQDVIVSFDNNHVYATGMYGVFGYNRNSITGALTYFGRVHYKDSGVYGLFDGTGIKISPDDDHIYVAARDSNSVVVLNRDNATGALAFNQAQEAIDGLNGVVGMAVSPDGKFLYATGGLDNSVVTIARDSVTGRLSSTQYIARDGDYEIDGLAGARSVVVSPDGLHAYVAGYDDNAVAVFARSVSSGYLAFVEAKIDGTGGVDGLGGAQDVTISPDGKHVYVAGQVDDAVAVFSRNASTGELTFVEREKDGVGGVDGLDGAYAVAVSPDGNHVYVVGYNDNAVVLFLRNTSNGALTYDSTYKNGEGIVDDELLGANDVVVHPEGNYVYVASRTIDGVAYFFRNPSNGRLLLVSNYLDTDPGLDGLDGARALAFSPDGGYLYVASQNDDAVAAFRWDSSNGALKYLGMAKDNQDGVDGLNTADGVAVSPDGLNVYAAGFGDDAVAVFARFPVFLPVVKKN